MRARVEKHRLKWQAAEEKKRARRAMLTEAMVQRRFKAEERRSAFENWWGEGGAEDGESGLPAGGHLHWGH